MSCWTAQLRQTSSQVLMTTHGMAFVVQPHREMCRRHKWGTSSYAKATRNVKSKWLEKSKARVHHMHPDLVSCGFWCLSAKLLVRTFRIRRWMERSSEKLYGQGKVDRDITASLHFFQTRTTRGSSLRRERIDENGCMVDSEVSSGYLGGWRSLNIISIVYGNTACKQEESAQSSL